MKELLAALDLETIPQISLGTAALLILAACALLAVVRGIFRILFGSLALCASGIAAYLAWVHTPAIAPGALPSWLSFVSPVAAALMVLFVLRMIGRFFTKPFRDSDADGERRRSPLRWVFTLLVSLVPTALLWFAGAAALRSAGSVAEIRRFADGEQSSDRSAFLAALKSAIDRTVPLEWLTSVDPLSEDARVTLAKLIALGDSEPPPKAIPVLEEPQIRALIENDPELRALAKARRYGDILRDPRLDHVMADPDLKRLLADLHL